MPVKVNTRIVRVGLRRGTRYQVPERNTLSEPRVLGQDMEVLVGYLGDVVNVYETDEGVTIVVRVEDEIRDRREDGADV